MDGRRFDRVTRALASGASRRSVLRGLLGLGGAAVAGTVTDDRADARTVGTRPTIRPPQPPPPTTTTSPRPTTTTADPCPPPGYRCGLDCCARELECCDGECCSPGSVCLTRVFDEGPSVEEEVCCLEGQTCDNRCCDGECYTPLGSAATGFGRSCCPAGGIVCNGDCCTGEELCGPDGVCCIPADSNQVCDDDADCCGNLICSPNQFCVPPSTTTTTTSSPATTTEAPCVQGPGFECCNTSDCVELGYGSVDCVGCRRDSQTGETSCIVLDTGESCGPGVFCCNGFCTSGPQCADQVCCFGGDCTEGECCDTFDCVELGYGNSPDCVSCTAGHACVVVPNDTICGINPSAVCCSGFCTTGTACEAPTTTEPPLCVSLGGACGSSSPSCCEGICSPPADGRCCIPDGQPCPANPDDCCGACTPGGTCGD
jgi:hypothetical protein